MEKIVQGIKEGTLNVKQFMTNDDVSHFDLFSIFRRKKEVHTDAGNKESNLPQKEIKCMYTNTDCLTNKLDELELFLQTEDIDIALTD